MNRAGFSVYLFFHQNSNSFFYFSFSFLFFFFEARRSLFFESFISSPVHRASSRSRIFSPSAFVRTDRYRIARKVSSTSITRIFNNAYRKRKKKSLPSIFSLFFPYWGLLFTKTNFIRLPCFVLAISIVVPAQWGEFYRVAYQNSRSCSICLPLSRHLNNRPL